MLEKNSRKMLRRRATIEKKDRIEREREREREREKGKKQEHKTDQEEVARPRN